MDGSLKMGTKCRVSNHTDTNINAWNPSIESSLPNKDRFCRTGKDLDR